jgi:hypothetical protein
MANKPTKAEVQRLAEAFRDKAEQLPEIPQQAISYIEGFIPAGADPVIWAPLAPTFREVMRMAGYKTDKTVAQHSTALGRYLLWRSSEHLSVEISDAMSFDEIDRFYVRALGELSQRTRNDYRARLRNLSTRANPSSSAPIVPPLGYNSVRPGYTSAEEATLRRVALRQPRPEPRRRLCAVVGLGGGAGLDPVDMRTQRVDGIVETEAGLVVITAGDKPRTIVVRRTYEELVRVAVEGRRASSLVLELGRDKANPVARAIEGAELFDDCPKVDMRRLRTTWITWLIQQRIPLNVILSASGLTSARTIVDMVAFLQSDSDVSVLRDGGAA